MSDFSKMSIEELEQHVYDLCAEEAELRAEKREAQAALGEKQEAAALKARIDGMEDAEKAALAQALEAEGVASDEEFGEL